MPAYVVIDVDVREPQAYEAYKRAGEVAVAAHGGRFLVRGGGPEVLEGAWSPKRVVVIQFPDRAAAKRWYDSPEYQAARKIREPVSTFDAVLVDGV